MAADGDPGPGRIPAILNQAMHDRRVVSVVGLLLIVGGLLVIARGLALFQGGISSSTVIPPPTRMAERLVPTLTVGNEVTMSLSGLRTGTASVESRVSDTPVAAMASATSLPSRSPTAGVPNDDPTVIPTTPAASAPSATPAPSSTVQLTPQPNETPGLFSPRQRIGFVAPMADVARYDAEVLGAGWYLSCINGENPLQASGAECAQLVVAEGDGYRPAAEVLQDTAQRNPGRLWLVGNEPDVIWQGNSTPEEYARVYHDVYRLLKEADPTSQVAIGGISQVTPLRLTYLEEVLAAYEAAHGQPMPVDVWNIHLAILREERDSWGVDIPPGLPEDSGLLYEIQDNADVEILKRQVVTFRRWMAERGLRDKPLIVTEFSVLMPPEYGFLFERVRGFMLAASDYMMTATDDDMGYPADGNRLVQRWAWYSIADETYYTGNLFDPDTGQITPLGRVFSDYAADW